MVLLRSAWVGALLSALTFALVSCGGDGRQGAAEPVEPVEQRSSDTPSPAPSTATPSPPSPTSFESDRHAYSLELPPGWVVSEFGGTWTSLDQFTPGSEVPGEDVASSSDAQGFLVANSMAIPNDMSPADWLEQLLRLTRSGRGPGCDEALDSDDLAGEQATVVEHRCEDIHLVGRSLTHAGRGYYFTIGFPAGDETARATLEHIVASVDLVEP
jgi:hypothetical protein